MNGERIKRTWSRTQESFNDRGAFYFFFFTNGKDAKLNRK